MKESTPAAIRREDYQPSAYLIDRVELELELDAERTVVRSTLHCRRAPGAQASTPLVLDGQELELLSVQLDSRVLTPDDYDQTAETLRIAVVPERFILRIVNLVRPSKNKALEGLYCSGPHLCTQCEAEGFRRITYFLDRPDVMARYTTRLVADATRYPALLSNGNRVASGALEGGKHFAVWEDPFPKPSYLFALVAADLACREGTFTTRSGRAVTLQVYVERDDFEQTEHCLQSLKRAMAWDEHAFGREYDLDTYMIVAVRDFNMGAMENKGLNIFNTKYVLAHADTATDTDFAGVESVVGHEYFHNWSGNRVTCRDWFQLSLKEGFTVFRDQEFSSDLGSRALKRIADVQRLWGAQFPEDAGPTAHPVRPDAYVEINNFYTPTVYEKGAEVVRMLHTLLGAETFRRGTDLYFERHDGQAVTCDDFVQAMQDASGRDLSQFALWYSQAGTPIVEAHSRFDSATQTLVLELEQRVPQSASQRHANAMLVPIRMGLIDASGNDLPLQLAGEAAPGASTRVIELNAQHQQVTFVGVHEAPVVSLLRGFSAPVRLEFDVSEGDLLLRMAADSDSFNRWDAAQGLSQRRIFAAMAAGRERPPLDDPYVSAFRRALESDADPALLAQALALPSETVLADRLTEVDPAALFEAREHVRLSLAARLEASLRAVYERLASAAHEGLDGPAMGRRSLRNVCLGYLMALAPAGSGGLALSHLQNASTMTDRITGLALLCDVEGPARTESLAEFYARYANFALVVDKWFAVQAMSRRGDTLAEVQQLLRHPAFSAQNPNRLRAVVDSLCVANPLRFHSPDGAGYAFLAERVLEVDRFNPQVASRILTPLSRFARVEPHRRALMLAALREILRAPSLSKDVFEPASKALHSAQNP